MGVSRGIIALSLLCTGSIATAATALQEIVVSDRPREETVLFAADRILRADEKSSIIAEGNVRAFYENQSLIADYISYDPTTDIVTANGNVVIYDADGQIFYADSVELTGDLADGVATNFGALIAEENRLVGSTVVRSSSGVNTIENGAYTACPVCREDGSTKTPTWEVKAVRVTQDKNDQTIRFRHATIEAFGVPIMYTPYFEFPDPSVERKSGLLPPSIGNSSRAGVEIEVPYYWAISDYQDITFAPRHTSRLGTVWKGEYRVNTHKSSTIIQTGIIDPRGVIQRPDSGLIVVKSEYTDAEIDNFLASGGNDDLGPRWHFFSKGERSFAENWNASFDIDAVSDKNYLRTYDIEPEDELREANDILQPDRLESRVSLTRLTDNTYTDLSSFMFQSLREAEDNDYNARALPRLFHERRYRVPNVGGEITFSTNFLYLDREEGLDSLRLTGQTNYEKVYTTQNGHRLRGYAEFRADTYSYRDADQGTQVCRGDSISGIQSASYEQCRTLLPRNGLEDEYSTARFLPTAGVEWSFPLAKFTTNASFIIEPRVQAVISPEKDFSDDIFNEDSAFFEFDAVTLFDWNKSTGYDQWEDGSRLNVGLAARANYTSGLNLSGSLGQQFRASESLQFEPDTGLGDETSDFVGELNAGYSNVFSMTNRFRFDDEDGTLRRLETSLRGRAGPVSTGVRYVRTESPELQADSARDENLTASAFWKVSDRWTVGGIWREDLDAGETTTQQFTIQYDDDCTIFSLDYRRDNRFGEGLNDNVSLTFNVDIIGF